MRASWAANGIRAAAARRRAQRVSAGARQFRDLALGWIPVCEAMRRRCVDCDDCKSGYR
jgi:hypothetical protein